MILSFRSITAKKLLAVVLRFPPLAKQGDTVAIRAGKTEFPLSVQQCDAGICVAVRTLAARGESLLLSNKDGIIVFPAGADGKQRAAKLPLEGAASALAAMRRAEG